MIWFCMLCFFILYKLEIEVFIGHLLYLARKLAAETGRLSFIWHQEFGIKSVQWCSDIMVTRSLTEPYQYYLEILKPAYFSPYRHCQTPSKVVQNAVGMKISSRIYAAVVTQHKGPCLYYKQIMIIFLFIYHNNILSASTEQQITSYCIGN